MSNQVTIDDYHELLALHRALMEAKFHGEPNDPAVPGSPFIAAVANRVVEALVAHDVERKGAAKREEWARWRAITPDRREWRLALGHATAMAKWDEWDDEMRTGVARTLMSPFVLGDATAALFVSEVTRARAA
jgi:hypothetical protein